MLTRRSLLGFIAASPFIVKAASIMPVRSLVIGDGVAFYTIEHPDWLWQPMTEFVERRMLGEPMKIGLEYDPLREMVRVS